MIIIDKRKSCICTCKDGTSYFIRKCPPKVSAKMKNQKAGSNVAMYTIYCLSQKDTKGVIAHYRVHNRLALPSARQKPLCTFGERKYLAVVDQYHLDALKEYIAKHPITSI